MLGIVLDLGAQPLHVDVDQAGVGGVLVAPHLLQQGLAAEHLHRLAGQGHEEVELQRSEGDADAAVPALAWWRGFRSAELTGLMESAQQYNLDIAVAIAQIVQADAQAGVSGAALLPSISGSANAERQRVATGSTTSLGGGDRKSVV